MRLEYQRVLPEASRAMGELEKVVESATLEPKLLELVKQRASQINGCAYCLDMHTKDAHPGGDWSSPREQRLRARACRSSRDPRSSQALTECLRSHRRRTDGQRQGTPTHAGSRRGSEINRLSGLAGGLEPGAMGSSCGA
jgi:AhpD family alkylhydroperoxidase